MNRVKELRTENKITQKQLANVLHTNIITISNWENGKYDPGYDNTQLLADYFQVSPLYILGFDTTEKVIADLKQQLVDAIKEIKQYRLLKVGLDDFIAEKDVLDVIDEIFFGDYE